MDDTAKDFKSKLPKPAKDIFEDFIYKEKSFDFFQPFESKQKKTNPKNFDGDVISILRYMFYCMYRNRIKPEFNFQEVAKLSYATIAQYSRVSVPTVKRLVPYTIEIGLINLISGGGKTRMSGTYCPGKIIYELYPQNLSTF